MLFFPSAVGEPASKATRAVKLDIAIPPYHILYHTYFGIPFLLLHTLRLLLHTDMST
jgi:hypothetical protein